MTFIIPIQGCQAFSSFFEDRIIPIKVKTILKSYLLEKRLYVDNAHIQSQSSRVCDSGDVAQDEEARLVHVSSDHDQEGGEGHVSNDQNWRRMDVNGNVPSEADDRFAKMISDKVTERLGIGSDKTLKTVIVKSY